MPALRWDENAKRWRMASRPGWVWGTAPEWERDGGADSAGGVAVKVSVTGGYYRLVLQCDVERDRAVTRDRVDNSKKMAKENRLRFWDGP